MSSDQKFVRGQIVIGLEKSAGFTRAPRIIVFAGLASIPLRFGDLGPQRLKQFDGPHYPAG